MKRWSVLIASIVLQIILGGIYAWSEFVPSLETNYNIDAGRSGLIFGVVILVFTVVMIFAGKVLARKGPRFTATIGAILYGIGYLTASFSSGNYYIIVLGIGVITGAGIGFGYVCPLTTCIKWFPRKKGLITGLAVAGFGGGAIILKLLVSFMQSSGLDTLMIFRNIAIFTGVPAVLAALLLSNPPNYDKIEVETEEEEEVQKILPLLKNSVIIAMIIGIFSGTFGGLLVVSNIKPIGLANNIVEVYAGLAIILFAIGNASGRIIWGTIFDKFGKKAIPISLIMLGISSLLLLSNLPVIFNLGSILTGIAFGGCFVLYFLRIVDRFGELAGQLYPYVFLAYGISAVLGPALGGWIYDRTGTYNIAIYCLFLITILGAFFVNKIEKNN